MTVGSTVPIIRGWPRLLPRHTASCEAVAHLPVFIANRGHAALSVCARRRPCSARTLTPACNAGAVAVRYGSLDYRPALADKQPVAPKRGHGIRQVKIA